MVERSMPAALQAARRLALLAKASRNASCARRFSAAVGCWPLRLLIGVALPRSVSDLGLAVLVMCGPKGLAAEMEVTTGRVGARQSRRDGALVYQDAASISDAYRDVGVFHLDHAAG